MVEKMTEELEGLWTHAWKTEVAEEDVGPSWLLVQKHAAHLRHQHAQSCSRHVTGRILAEKGEETIFPALELEREDAVASGDLELRSRGSSQPQI